MSRAATTPMTDEPQAADMRAIRAALGLFESCIKSGEAWSESCRDARFAALVGVSNMDGEIRRLREQAERAESALARQTRLLHETERRLDENTQERDALIAARSRESADAR